MSAFYDKCKIVLIIAALSVSALSISGCRPVFKEKDHEDGRVVAKIDNYEMTVSDFKDELRSKSANKYQSANPIKAKEELMEELITKKILLQEAQEENFDKDKLFMKEIERYWEQALLKILLKKKSDELSNTIHVSDSEAMNEYLRMRRKIYAELIMTGDKDAAKGLSSAGENLDQAKANFKEKIISDEGPEWWVTGDLPKALEDALFSLKPGESSKPVSYGDSWTVIRSLKEEELKLTPFEKISQDIRKKIFDRKKEEMLEKWMGNLRKNAKVSVDKKVLEEITLP